MAQKCKYVALWPGKTQIKEVDLPPLRDDQILVRVELSGLCGTDLHVWEVGYGPHRISGEVPFPLIPGHEYVGIIEKKGKKADEVMLYHTDIPEEGDRIYWGLDYYCYKCSFCFEHMWPQWCINAWFYGFSPEEMGLKGGWSQYVILEPATRIWKLPKDKISEKEGVLIEPFIVGLRSVDRALTLSCAIAEREGLPAAGSFAIYGVGTIGLMALMALRNYLPQATIIALDLKKHRLDMAKELGADFTINVSETTREERVKEIKEIATSLEHEFRRDMGSRWGVDIVFDCTGRNAKDVIPEAIEILRPGGILEEVGAYVFKPAGEFSIDPHEICSRELIFTGNWAYPLSTIEKGTKMVLKGLFKKFDATRLVTHVHPLEEVDLALKQAQACEGIKHVFDPWK